MSTKKENNEDEIPFPHKTKTKTNKQTNKQKPSLLCERTTLLILYTHSQLTYPQSVDVAHGDGDMNGCCSVVVLNIGGGAVVDEEVDDVDLTKTHS